MYLTQYSYQLFKLKEKDMVQIFHFQHHSSSLSLSRLFYSPSSPYACLPFLFQLNSIILMIGEEIRVVCFQIIVLMITITQMEGS